MIAGFIQRGQPLEKGLASMAGSAFSSAMSMDPPGDANYWRAIHILLTRMEADHKLLISALAEREAADRAHPPPPGH